MSVCVCLYDSPFLKKQSNNPIPNIDQCRAGRDSYEGQVDQTQEGVSQGRQESKVENRQAAMGTKAG